MNTLFLINKRSGAKRGYDLETVIRDGCRTWTAAYDIAPCERKEDLDAILADAQSRGVEVVYAVGGDGTVHEIGKRLIGTGMALGVLPAGSGNGFARHLGLPMEPRASLASCAGRRIVTIDTAEVNGMPFLGVMGIGFDAEVADQFAESKVRGFLTYVKIGLRGWIAYRPQEYELTIDGERLTRRAFVVAVANSSQYGNDAWIAPLASLQDGLLDLVLVERGSWVEAPFLLARLFQGSLHKSNAVTMRRGARITIRRPGAGPGHLDGEPMKLPAELQVSVRPKSLKVLVPDRERPL